MAIPLSWFDLALVIIIGGFALFGLWFGFVHTLGSLLGTVFGAFFASRYYEPLSVWLMKLTGWQGNTTKVVAFILAFIVISRLIGFAFWLVDRLLSVITRLPFISSLNHLLGLALGFVEGLLTIGLVIYFIERFPVAPQYMQMLANSKIAPEASKLAHVFIPLLPEALKLLNSTVDYVQNKFM